MYKGYPTRNAMSEDRQHAHDDHTVRACTDAQCRVAKTVVIGQQYCYCYYGFKLLLLLFRIVSSFVFVPRTLLLLLLFVFYRTFSSGCHYVFTEHLTLPRSWSPRSCQTLRPRRTRSVTTSFPITTSCVIGTWRRHTEALAFFSQVDICEIDSDGKQWNREGSSVENSVGKQMFLRTRKGYTTGVAVSVVKGAEDTVICRAIIIARTIIMSQ